MKQLFLTILFSSMCLIAFAQKKTIEVKTEKTDTALQIFCINNSDYTQEVTLTLKKLKGLKGYKKPMVKQIAPNSKDLFISLTHKGAYGYSTSLSYKKIMTKKDKQLLEEKKKDVFLKDFSKVNKGIVVFEKTNCARCTYATSYLLDNKIDFKMINITESIENNKLMWQLLKKEGVSSNVTTPVILVDGKLSHSHKDLRKFAEGLKK